MVGMNTSLKTVLAFSALSSLILACNDSGFNSQNQRTKPNPPPAQSLPAEPATGAGGQFTQEFTSEASRAVDVVIAVDTSGSMLEEMQSIEQNMATFLNQLTSGNLDSKVTVIAKATDKKSPNEPPFMTSAKFNFPATLPQERFGVVDHYIHSHDALGILNKYFAGSLGFPHPLRAGVPLEIVVVSDDNGSNTSFNGTTTGNLATEFQPPQDKSYVVNAIVGLVEEPDPFNPANPNCVIENVGTEHLTLADRSKGLKLDICATDWSGLLKKVSDAIIARNGGFVLQHAPRVDQTIVVKVNGAVVDPKDYLIDAANKLLTFQEAYVLPPGAKIEISYFYQ